MLILYLLFSLDLLVLSLYLPVFGPYLKSIGSTRFEIGIIQSASALISLIWNPIVGTLSDSKGRRSLLIKSAAAGALGSICMSLTSSITLIFFAKIIAGFASPINILLKTITTDVCKTNEEKNTILHRSTIISCVTFIFGAVLSGFISERKNGNSLVFLLMAFIFLLQIAIAFCLPDDSRNTTKTKSHQSILSTASKEIKSALVNVRNIDWEIHWDLFASKGAVDLSYGLLASNLGLLMVNEYHMNGPKRGYFFTMLSVFTIIGTGLKIKFKKYNVNHSKVLMCSAVLVACYLTLGVFTSIYAFLSSVAILTMTKAYLDCLFTELITSRAKVDEKGKVISSFENLYLFSMFVSPLISGYIANVLGERITISLGIIPCTVAVLISFYKSKSKTE